MSPVIVLPNGRFMHHLSPCSHSGVFSVRHVSWAEGIEGRLLSVSDYFHRRQDLMEEGDHERGQIQQDGGQRW